MKGRHKAGPTARVEALLQESGPLSRAQVERALPDVADAAARALSWLRKHNRVHIAGWITEVPGQRPYPRAMFAAGPGPEPEPPPEPTRAEIARRYRMRKAGLLPPVPVPVRDDVPPPRIEFGLVPSVFGLGYAMASQSRRRAAKSEPRSEA